MKNFLLITLFSISFFAISQNPPVAVNDTLIIHYDEIHEHDSLAINAYKWQLNDYDPDGTTIKTVSATMLSGSTNSISIFNPTGYIMKITIHSPNSFVGLDSIQYVIQDGGTPVMYDTGIIYLDIKPKIHETLDANNIAARVDIFTLFKGFEAPVGSGSHSIYSSNLWVAGKHNNTVYSSIKTFGRTQSTSGLFNNQGSNTGPVSINSAQFVEYNPKWDKVWKVKQYEIDYHLASWTSLGYTPPPAFLTWPAHGDTTIGEAYYLAPFVDFDNDGHYNPYLGDYPVIKGDQAIYFIYNDGGSTQSLNPMTSEIHGMAYAFHCQDSALENTIFVDYRIINRSNNTYDSTYFGMWSDMDLGNAEDDYIQCDVNRSLFFTYNGDAYDDDNSGKPGYGSYIPAQAAMLLKGAKKDDDGQDNGFGINLNESVNGTGFGDGVADNEFWGMNRFVYFNRTNGVTGDPQNDIDFYNYLTGKWRDNTEMRYGGSGHQNSFGATSTIAKFMFPNISDTYNFGTGGVSMPAWNEVTANNDPFDRRGVFSTGPVTFAPGDEIELTYAFVFGRDYVNMGAQAGVDNMLKRADSIRSYFDQGMLNACGFPVSVQKPIDVKSDLVIYPNPTKNVVNIRQEKAENITIQVLDITGKVLLTKSSKNQLITVDLSGFVNGVYLVKVTSGNKITVQKIVKY